MEEDRYRERRFFLLWLGQFVSSFGTVLTSFAVGVWVYQETGSTSKLSFTLLSSSLPGVLSAPLIGSLIDRYDRRRILIVSNLGAFLGVALFATLAAVGDPGLATVCSLLAVVTVFRTAQWPTFSALITYLVPKERLGKANGLVELGRSISEVGAPVLGGFLLARMEIAKILTIDAGTYLFSLLILWSISFRDTVGDGKKPRTTLTGEAWEGFLYIWNRSGLWTFLLLFSALNLVTGMLQVIVTPFVLSLATTEVLGVVVGVAGSGMVIGGLAVSARGVPERKIRWTLGLLTLQGAALGLVGFAPGLISVTFALFVFMTIFPILSGMSQVIWQTRVERSYHGRIFSIRRTILTATVPVAYLISGPLADYFAVNAASLTPELWSFAVNAEVPAETRGLGLLFSALGALTLVFVLAASRRKALYELDDD